MARSDDDIPPPPPPQTRTPIQQTPHIVSTIKLLILKKGEYDIWAMKMEHYLSHIDYPIWEVIQRGNGHVSVSTDTNGVIKVLPPKTAEEILAIEKERKARTTLLMALPKDHLAKFHKMTDVKEMWEAIKSRFAGNDESNKMHKYILKQQFKGFSVSNSEGLHKGYDRFQSLLSQLKIHDAGVSTEDANQKFLRVFESDVKGSTASSSSTQNVAFVSENTSYTNDVSTTYGVSNSSGHNSQCANSSSYSFLANQSNCPQLDHEDLEQLDEFDLEEMDLKCRRRDAWNTRNKDKDNGRRSGKQEEFKALVTLDGDGVDWTSHSEDEQENYALMAYSNSGSDTEREQLGDASIEIQAYTQALKKVKAQLQSKPSESDARSSDFNSCESNSSKETLESMPEPVVNESKVWFNVKKTGFRIWFTKKGCFVCGSFIHLIRDYNFHEKRMAKQVELNKRMCKGTSQRENRPAWNNVQRVNHQNQFVPTAVLTRTGRIPVNTARTSSTNNVNTARHHFNSQAVPTNAAWKFHTVKPIVNNLRPKTIFQKTYSPIRRPFNRTTTSRTKFSNQKDNTAEVKAVSAVRGERETAVKPSADYPQRALKNKGIIDSGCSRYMTGNKAYLAEYQDFNGGPVAFGGSSSWLLLLG
ncbi:hypothetical protein Tco_0475510 [Tanacetum coccineum]